MASIVSKNGGLTNDMWNVNAQMMEAYINDVNTEQNNYDDFVNKAFNVKKSNRFGEQIGSYTEFGDFVPAGADGASATLDDIQSGPTKMIQHTTFKKLFRVTREMNEDSKVDVMQAKARNMVQAYKRTRAAFASTALTACAKTGLTAPVTTFEFAGVTGFDCAAADGKGLFATDHPGVKTGVAAQSNVFKNAFGSDATMLNRLANIGRNLNNSSGVNMGYTFNTIIIPSNCYALEDTIKKIIRTDLMVGSQLNDINTQKGLWTLIVDPCWQADSGKAPYIIMSTDANKELLGNKLYDRVALDVTSDVDISTNDMIWNGYARMSVGFPSWQHVILGGAAYGTELA